jgi:hypothetical protein
MNQELANHPGWQWGTFEGAELNALLVGLKTSLREKILWMEEMQAFHEKFAEARAKRISEEKAGAGRLTNENA